MKQLTWIKSRSGSWLSFDRVVLKDVNTEGVYIIWSQGSPSRVIYVGQGDIARRIKCHRERPEITQYKNLLVTWAEVSARDMNGVERYLADRWKPLVGDAYPVAVPIAVNSPW